MKFVEAVCAYVSKLYHDGLAAFEALDGFGLERVEGEVEDFGRRRRRRRGERARRRSNIALRVRHIVQAGQKFFAQASGESLSLWWRFCGSRVSPGASSADLFFKDPVRASMKRGNAESSGEKIFLRNGNTNQERHYELLGRRRCAGNTSEQFLIFRLTE